ncbi:MAG: carboxypeptidase-like regulatory domain-containing protein [Bacteroidota bacterium]
MNSANEEKQMVDLLDRGIRTGLFLIVLLAISLSLMIMVGCSSDSNDETASVGGQIAGVVQDEDGNTYPGISVTASKGPESTSQTTDKDGNYSITTRTGGTYEVSIAPPLATDLASSNPASVNVTADQQSTADFIVQPQPVVATLNFGQADIFNEIRDEDGNAAATSGQPIYAANFFQEPIGKLTAVKAPDGHHVTLGEWKEAKGELQVSCDGNSATVVIELEGLIPDGTYTFWLAFLNKTKKIGQSVGPSDFVHPINPPLRSGTDNVLIADAEGKIQATILHPSCILTDEVALVIPIIYHINGNTFGAGVIPDVEEVSHLLAYFQ